MKRLSVSIFLLLAFTFVVLAPVLRAADVVPDALVNYNVTTLIDCEGGAVSPMGARAAASNEPFVITITPNDRYLVNYIIVNNVVINLKTPAPYTYTANADSTVFTFTIPNVTENMNVLVCFASAGLPSYTITSSVDGGCGDISPAGAASHVEGSTTSFRVVPNAGGAIAEVLVDGVDILPESHNTSEPYIYTFDNITASHTIVAKFVRHTVTLEYHWTDENGEAIDVATYPWKGMVIQAIGPNLGAGISFTGATWSGASGTACQGYTANFMTTTMGIMNPNITQALWIDSIFVDDVKYTGTITNGMMPSFNPAIPVTVNADVVIKLYMSPGAYSAINLNFVYDTPDKPTERKIQAGTPFTNSTIDGAKTKALAGSSFDLNYQLLDLNANNVPDCSVDSIYLDGALWNLGTVPAEALGMTPIPDFIPTVAASMAKSSYTITMYIHNAEKGSIVEVDIPSLSINPNPVESKAVITKDAEVIFTKIDIIDILGNVVITINNPSDELDIAKLNRGSYIVRFYTKDGFASRSIIKQ